MALMSKGVFVLVAPHTMRMFSTESVPTAQSCCAGMFTMTIREGSAGCVTCQRLRSIFSAILVRSSGLVDCNRRF